MIKNIYEQHKAKLINAHGTMLNNVKTVPKNTVLMFLSNPGYCTVLPVARSVYHEFFETKKGLEKFLNGNIPKNRIYISNIKNRTHLPGQEYKNMSLTFNNKNEKGLAYIHKLPLTTLKHVLGHYSEYNKPPKFAETVGPIKRGTKTKLSNVLSNVGPGVYIVASCRRTLQNKEKKYVPLNMPGESSWPYGEPIHPTNVTLRRKNNSLVGKHPGSFNSTLKAERTYYLEKIKKKRNTIKNVLAHMSKNSGKSPFRTYIGPLNANTNVDKLKNTRNALLNKSKLPITIRSKLLLTPTNKKAQVIYKYYLNKS